MCTSAATPWTSRAGHPTADTVAGFNGFNWAPLGSNGAGNGPLNAAVNALTVFGGQVVAGGNFIGAGGDGRADFVARYPGAAHPLTAVIRLGGGGFSPFVGSTASFDGTASDGDAPIVSYRWTWNDGAPDSSGPTVAHVLTKQGTNVVTLIVTDSAGHTAQASEDFFIAGMYPQARFAWTPSRCSPGRPSRSTGARRATPTGASPPTTGNGATAPPTSTARSGPMSSPRPAPTRWPCSCADDNTQSGAAIHNVTVVPLIVPKVSHVAMTRTRFRVGSRPTAVSARTARGTSFKFTLKAPAKVTVTIARRARGARRGKRCVSPRRAHGKRCTRAVKAGTLTRKNLPNGGNAIAFSGRIGKRALKPGRYTATLRARNAKGASKPVVVKFTVVK
jgi:hypothetical protein